MSANNQTLVKKHGDRWFVFPNTNAESWDEKNILNLSREEWSAFFDKNEAIKYAQYCEHEDSTEYGIVEEVLYKDGAPVVVK